VKNRPKITRGSCRPPVGGSCEPPAGGRADFQKLAEKETMNNTNFEQKKKLKQNKLIKNDQRFHLPS